MVHSNTLHRIQYVGADAHAELACGGVEQLLFMQVQHVAWLSKCRHPVHFFRKHIGVGCCADTAFQWREMPFILYTMRRHNQAKPMLILKRYNEIAEFLVIGQLFGGDRSFSSVL